MAKGLRAGDPNLKIVTTTIAAKRPDTYSKDVNATVKGLMYYYDDKDEPQFHASSGITRNFVPKPAYHSMAHFNKTLGDYRFVRALAEDKGEMYAYEFMDPNRNNETVWVFWSPTGDETETTKQFPLKGARAVKAERMPLKAGPAEPVTIQTEADSAIIPLTESPLYVWMTSK